MANHKHKKFKHPHMVCKECGRGKAYLPADVYSEEIVRICRYCGYERVTRRIHPES